MRVPGDSRAESVYGSPDSQPGLRQRMKREVRRVSSQHRKLEEFFRLVVASLERGSLVEAAEAFRPFRDALEAHLSLEDDVFFPALHGLDPVLGREFAQLSREHASFRETVDELEAGLGAGDVASFRERFERFASEVAEHEHYEEQLIARISGTAP